MKGFEPVLDECEETYGALEPDDNANLTIELMNGSKITTDVVGIDHDDNILRHFTWETLEEENLRAFAEEQGFDYEVLLNDDEIELGETFLMMNGLTPWDNVAGVTGNTSTLFGRPE